MSQCRLVYGKACHLPMELKQSLLGNKKDKLWLQSGQDKKKSMIWANLLAVSTSLPPLSLKQSLNELEGLKNESYECAQRAKVKTKFYHNQMLLRKKF